MYVQKDINRYNALKNVCKLHVKGDIRTGKATLCDNKCIDNDFEMLQIFLCTGVSTHVLKEGGKASMPSAEENLDPPLRVRTVLKKTCEIAHV